MKTYKTSGLYGAYGETMREYSEIIQANSKAEAKRILKNKRKDLRGVIAEELTEAGLLK